MFSSGIAITGMESTPAIPPESWPPPAAFQYVSASRAAEGGSSSGADEAIPTDGLGRNRAADERRAVDGLGAGFWLKMIGVVVAIGIAGLVVQDQDITFEGRL